MNRLKFLMEMLSSAGVPSSKRGALLFFSVLFAAVIITNLCTGGEHGVKLAATLQDQLFEALLICFATVFGEPVMKYLGSKRQQTGQTPPDSGKQ